MYSRKERENIIAIKRRIAFLDIRFNADRSKTFDGVELRALRWALDEIEAARGSLPESKEPEEVAAT